MMAGFSHLRPGERGGIITKVDTLSRKGSVADTIEVVSNDPVRPKIILTLKAHIRDRDTVSPPK
jgi:hypothetical protein